MARRDQERRINFVKDILGTLASILPDVGNAIGTRRYFSEEDTLAIISAMTDILESYTRSLA